MIRVREFYDESTSTLTYVVWDPDTRDAVVIDPVWNYDAAASRVSDESVRAVAAFVGAEKLVPHFVLETHAHADHLSGAQLCKAHFPKASLAVGKRITDVQSTFKRVFDLPAAFPTDGRQFDRLFHEGESVRAGSLAFEVRFTPGHTPACGSYVFADAVFTGDALFMPDSGVGRCDFPGGSAEALYTSVTEQLYRLPDSMRVFTGHDYRPGGRPLRFEASIGEQKSANIHLNVTTTREAFEKFRTERDKTLGAPKLLWPSVQVNVNGGRLPPPHDDGRRYLRIPVNGA